jgi:hypothetical protein
LFPGSIFKPIHKAAAAAGFLLEWVGVEGEGGQLIQLHTPHTLTNPIAKLTQLVLLSARTPLWGFRAGGSLCSTHSLMCLQIPAVRFPTLPLHGGERRDSFDLLGAQDLRLNAPSGDIQKPHTLTAHLVECCCSTTCLTNIDF